MCGRGPLHHLEDVIRERDGLDDVFVGLVVPVPGDELHRPGARERPAAQGRTVAVLLDDVEVPLVVDVGQPEAVRGDRDILEPVEQVGGIVLGLEVSRLARNSVRPTEQSKPAIARFMRLCTCLWGGRFNPIIPVARTMPADWRRDWQGDISARGLADAYIRFFEPDVFIEAEPGLAAEAGIQTGSGFLGSSRVVPLDKFVTAHDRRRPDFFFGLNIFELYRHLYDRELQFVSRRKRHFAAIGRSQDGNLFAEAALGVFPRDARLVLTGHELFAEWGGVAQAWKRLGGRHAGLVQHPSVRLDDLWTLADLTQQLYLDMPGCDDAAATRRRKRQGRMSGPFA